MMSKTLNLSQPQATTIQLSASNSLSFWLVTFFVLIAAHIPYLSWLLAPVNLFTTAVHEMGHAIVCLATGGSISGLTIVSDGSGHGGLTFCQGGLPFFYAQAGYLGAAFFGCVLIYLSQYPKVSRALLGGLGVAMGLATIFFVPGAMWVPGHFLQGFGSLVAAAVLSGLLLTSCFKLKAGLANLLVLFLAVETALNSLTLIGDLISVSMGWVPYGAFSDATNMTNMTGIPAIFWGILWGMLSLAMVAFTLVGTYGKRLIPTKGLNENS